MKRVVSFTKLITALREDNPGQILCREFSTGIIHLADKGAQAPHCLGWRRKPNVNRQEVLYFNGGHCLDKFCPNCFKKHQQLLELLAEERPGA